jgi:hypothetical protein
MGRGGIGDQMILIKSVVIEDWTGPIIVSAVYSPPRHNVSEQKFWDYFNTALIIGMRDDTLRDRLQLEKDLKLETAVNIIRKSEDLVR